MEKYSWYFHWITKEVMYNSKNIDVQKTHTLYDYE